MVTTNRRRAGVLITTVVVAALTFGLASEASAAGDGAVVGGQVDWGIKASFRTPIRGVAVGIYLPFGLSVLIFVGGILAWLVERKFAPKTERDHVALENSGMLLASGLITGEAIMGVALAGVVYYQEEWGQKDSPLIPKDHIAIAGPLTLAVTAVLIVYLYVRTLGAARRM